MVYADTPAGRGLARAVRSCELTVISISISEADGADPLPICRANREWIVERYKVPTMIALKFLDHEAPGRGQEAEAGAKVVRHLHECPKCRAWVHRIVPADAMRRQKRLSRYCCASMFCACEEAKAGDTSISFELFRGEDPCWKIDGNYSFISYCPWCGRKLPERPFLED